MHTLLAAIGNFLPGIIPFILIAGFAIWELYRIKNSPEIKKSHRKLNDLADHLKMMLNTRYEIIPRPVIPPLWQERFQQKEEVILEMGFRSSHYYRDVTRARVGRPNFTSVYLSEDKRIVVELELTIRPRSGGSYTGLTAETGVERLLIACYCRFPGPNWVEYVESSGQSGNSDLPPAFHLYHYDAGLTTQQILERYLVIQESLPWSYTQAIPYTSRDNFMEDKYAQLEILHVKTREHLRLLEKITKRRGLFSF